uniref:Uncharacterized protein n=1 Tax=Spiroplasma citri TaxID=2133 RepID=Q14LT0_SPICI|nr:hypothetical protein SPICI16_025 [Spiroplasma citri]
MLEKLILKEEAKKEYEEFVDIAAKFINTLWEEDKLKKEINFDFLSKNKINKIYKELKDNKEYFFNIIVNIFATSNTIKEIKEENKISFNFKGLNTKIVFDNIKKIYIKSNKIKKYCFFILN